MSFWNWLTGGQSVVAERALTAGETDDVWSLVPPLAPFDKATLASLEKVYGTSGIVGACVDEILSTCSDARVEASAGVRLLFEIPNAYQDFEGFISSVLVSWLTTGRFYVAKLPLEGRATSELHVLQPSLIKTRKGKWPDLMDRVVFTPHGEGRGTTIPLDRLVWRLRTGLNPGQAVSPLEAVWEDIQTDLDSQTYRRRVLRRLPFMFGVAQTGPMGPKSKEQRDELQKSMRKVLGSDALVMPPDVTLAMPRISTDFALLPVATHAEARISAALNVPAVLVGLSIGLEKMTYSNYQEARLSFREETVVPLLSMLGRAFSKGLREAVAFVLPPIEPPIPSAVTISKTETTSTPKET